MIDWDKYHLENDRESDFFKTIKFQIEQLSGVSSILEVGCGYCYNLQPFKFTHDCFGMDTNQDVLLQAASRNKEGLSLYQDDITNLHLSYVPFDLVFCVAVLEHLNFHDVRVAMQNMKALSKKYIFTIEAYDEMGIEREINWKRGFMHTINLQKRWSDLKMKIIRSFPLNSEYWFCLVGHDTA